MKQLQHEDYNLNEKYCSRFPVICRKLHLGNILKISWFDTGDYNKQDIVQLESSITEWF